MEQRHTKNTISVRQVIFPVGALVLSVGFHGVLLRSFSDVPVGRIPDFAPRALHESTRLDRVQLEPPETLTRPETYRLENPDASMADAVAELLPPPIDASWMPRASSAKSPSASAVKNTAEVSPLPERSQWQARQEVVQIEEKRFNDRDAFLPRKYTADVPRSMNQPDFTPPVDVAEFASAALPNAAGGSGVADWTADAGAVGSFGGEHSLEMLPEVDLSDSLLEEAEVVLDEAPESLTEAMAVEDLLKLDLTTSRIAGDPYTYFKLDILRNGQDSLPVLAKDVLIIQDASKSMTQRKLESCKQGIYRVLDELNEGDRFNIIAFRDEIIWAFPQWQSYEGPVKARVRYFLDDLKATGKTDVSGSLESIVGLRKDQDRAVIAMLVTDGRPTMGLVDTSDIIVRVSEANEGDVSVFALGGGARVNRFLLDMLSYNNRGDSLVVEERNAIPAALADWSAQLDRPVLTDLHFRFNGLEEGDIFPKTLTHLFLDRPLQIYGRTRNPSQPIAFRIDALSSGKAHDMVFQLALPTASEGNNSIREEWAWHKAYSMIGEHIMTDSDSLKEQIRKHAKDFSITIPYASEFIPFSF